MSAVQGSSYYQQINNVQFDRKALQLSESLQAGQGDGRISVADAQQLSAQIYDGPGRTDTEDATVQRIYDTVNFTQAGRDAFEHANRSAGAQRGWETRRQNATSQAAQTISPSQSVSPAQNFNPGQLAHPSPALQNGALAAPTQASAGVAIQRVEQD